MHKIQQETAQSSKSVSSMQIYKNTEEAQTAQPLNTLYTVKLP